MNFVLLLLASATGQNEDPGADNSGWCACVL